LKYWTRTGLSSPSFSVAVKRHCLLAWSPPHIARAGSLGAMKKITNVTNVIMKKRKIAHKIRLIKYLNNCLLLL
jgi:uridine phosphorylase